jgi:hypothetical protein
MYAMSASWKKHDAGFFTLDLPVDWVIEEPPSAGAGGGGSILIHDAKSQIALSLVALSKPPFPNSKPRPVSSKEVQFELQKWIDCQKHVTVRQSPRLLSGTAHLTATTEGLQHLRTGMSWIKRVLRRGPLMLWRFWAILNPHMLVLASCNGKPDVVEKNRPTLDRILLSMRLPDRNILLGRHFTDTVVSLARSYFPQMPVAVIDDAHLQFGSQNVSLTNLHRRYLASPENLSTHVRAFFSEVQNELPASDLAGAWSRASEHILPVLLTQEGVNAAAPDTLIEPWINTLSISYMLEDNSDTAANPAAARAITHTDLKRWNVSPETLHDTALQNLIVLSHEQTMEGQKSDGYTMLVLATPDKHNAARILLPEFHRKLREHLGPTFYAAIPTPHFLLAFNTTRDEFIVRLRQQISADYHRSKEPLSEKLFLVTPDGIAGDPNDAEDFDL